MTGNPSSSAPPWGSTDPFETQRRNREIARPAGAGMTEILLLGAELRPGLQVLDLACGAGNPAIDIARRVSPGGRVVGVDVSQAQLDSASAFARFDGVTNIEFRMGDAGKLAFPDASFDRVTSRFGPMFFPDLGRALREAHRVLRPGGRLAWLVWGPFNHQPLFESTAGVAMRHAGLTELPPEAAQPFRFGAGGVLAPALEAAGFLQPKESRQAARFDWSLSPEDLTRYWWDSPAPPFEPMMAALSPGARREAVAETTERFRAASVGGQVRFSAEVILATGQRGMD